MTAQEVILNSSGISFQPNHGLGLKEKVSFYELNQTVDRKRTVEQSVRLNNNFFIRKRECNDLQDHHQGKLKLCTTKMAFLTKVASELCDLCVDNKNSNLLIS